jgi:hypothetical protein
MEGSLASLMSFERMIPAEIADTMNAMEYMTPRPYYIEHCESYIATRNACT